MSISCEVITKNGSFRNQLLTVFISLLTRNITKLLIVKI